MYIDNVRNIHARACRGIHASAGRYYRDTGISRYFISVIRIAIQFGRIAIFSSLFIVTICC